LLIDANNVGGRHHVVLGTLIAGTFQTRVNVKNVVLRNIKAINIPTDPTGVNTRNGVYVVIYQPGLSEATQNSIQNFKCYNVRLEGGEQGFTLAGSSSVPGAGANIWVDDFVFEDCWHSTGSVPTAGYSAANYFIGSQASVGRGKIVRCYGYGSGDEGIEIDGCIRVDVVDTVIEEAFSNCFFVTIYNYPTFGSVVPSAANGIQGLVTFTRCTAVYRNYAGTCWQIFGSAAPYSLGPGDVLIEDCNVVWNNPTQGTVATVGTGGWAIKRTDGAAPATFTSSRLTVRNFKVAQTNISYGGAGLTSIAIDIHPNAASTHHFDLKGFHWSCQGAVTAGPGFNCFGIRCYQGNQHVIIEDVYPDINVTGLSAGSVKAVTLGQFSSATASLAGRVNGVRFRQVVGDTAPVGVLIEAQDSTITVSEPFVISGVDVHAIGVAGAVAFQTNLITARNTCRLRDIAYATYPKPSAAMGVSNFATSTFTTATGNRYLGGHQALIQFLQGSGAGITAIDMSKDGTTYENYLTQAAGAMPSGTDLFIPVDNGDYIKVTFATTQPTTRVVFLK